MSYKLKINLLAEDDLKNLYLEGIGQWGEEQADEYYDALLHHFEILCENPFLFRAVDDIRPGYRRSVCGRHAIYYRIRDNNIEIMAVIKHQNILNRL